MISAKDIFIKGGHVIPILKDQVFRLFYDNKRQIIEPLDLTGQDLSNILLDSAPLRNAKVCKRLRFFSKFAITLPYNKNYVSKTPSKYKS